MNYYKMRTLQNILFTLCLFSLTVGLSQQKSYITEKNVWFDLEVRVVDKDTKQPIKNAAVSVNGRQFRYDIIKDFYLVKAQVGQQLTVTHLGFESVYYIIESNEEIKIEVEDFDNIRNRGVKSKKTSRSDAYGVMSRFSNETDSYNQNLDSAIFYKEKNIEKSLSFIEEILKRNQSRGRNAATYKLLGDVYNQWKQYDLAIANYKNSSSLYCNEFL